MLEDDLEEQAALYAAGALTAEEREQFELVLEFHDEVRALVKQLQEVTAAAMVATIRGDEPEPSADLKSRIMAKLDGSIAQEKRHGFVMAGPDGFVQWVNAEFTEMCGHTLEELRGKKLGPILQGQLTDTKTANLMRTAVQERRRCRAELINYHKNGTPYWVRVDITPIFKSTGETRWLVAREEELKDREIPVGA